ncbi:MAG: hypothetical protein WDM71_09345 [Ferruginibacter sp.]
MIKILIYVKDFGIGIPLSEHEKKYLIVFIVLKKKNPEQQDFGLGFIYVRNYKKAQWQNLGGKQ